LPRGGDINLALLERWALSYLARYASSAATLRRVLLRRAQRRLAANDGAKLRAVDGLIDGLVERYRATQLINDAAYAAARVRRDVARGRSLRHIAADLAQKGIARDEADEALDALRQGGSDPDLAAAVAFARRRHLGPFGGPPVDRLRALAAFGRAGFSRPTAERVLDCADGAAVDVLLSDNAGR
jgi:regulatory protein